MSYTIRISNLRTKFKDTLDAVLITDTSNITYFTGYSNFSPDEREAYLFITKHKQYLVTDGRYTEAVEKHIPHVTVLEKNAKQSLKDIFKKIIETDKVGKVGLEYGNLTIAEERSWVTELFSQNWDFPVATLREVKENFEVTSIENSCKLGDQAFEYILGKIKSGVTEQELAFELEMFIKQKGADLSFKPIVAFGANSFVPHHETGNTKLHAKGTTILLDFGIKLDNYCSDMTRTVFFGHASAREKKMYEAVLEAQKKALEHLSSYSSSEHKRGEKLHKESSRLHSNNKKTLTSIAEAEQNEQEHGIKASDVDKVAREYIMKQGFPTIPHSLGHGIGIQVHEAPHLSPVSDEQLLPGMVFSIEPGIYIPRLGGIRIEDLVVLKTSGPKLLTHAKKNLIEL